jgi:hypothetical protein
MFRRNQRIEKFDEGAWFSAWLHRRSVVCFGPARFNSLDHIGNEITKPQSKGFASIA